MALTCPHCGGTLLQEYGRKGRGLALYALWRCRPCKRVVAQRRIRG